MRLETAIKEYLAFLKNPIFDYKRDQPLDMMVVIKLFFIVFAVEMLLFIPISAALGVEDIPHSMESIMENMSTWQVVGLAVVLAPLMEELLFRFHLRYKVLSIMFLALVSLAYAGLIGSYFFPDAFSDLGGISEALVGDPFLLSVGLIAILLSFGVFYLIFRQVEVKNIASYFPFLFYLTALVFALVHISNFQLPAERWFIAPLLVVPQFILACYLGYIRVRNNIQYSIFIHAFNNAIPVMLFNLAT